MGVHLWYLEFLFAFSIITLPLFLYLRTSSGSRLMGSLARFLSRPWMIFLLALPIGVAEFVAELPPIDGTILGNEGFGGWSTLPYLTLLIIGYVLATSEGLARAMERHRVHGLLAGALSFCLAWFAYKASEQWSAVTRELLMSPIRGVICWSCLVAICGFAGRHLRFSSRFLKYANEAVLPFYVLHQTVILTVGFYVTRLDTSLWLEYLIIVFSSFAVTLALYEPFIKRFNALRFLFGMKLLARQQSVGGKR
jgi:surface polysaccharide O-acyltransferase-like enzyme